MAMVAMLGYLERPPSGAAINASVLLEMLVLSFALADRVRQLRGEREQAIREGQEKSSFLAMLSHEVRTPLNGIMGTIELLGRTRLSGNQKGYVDNLRNAGNALMSLLNDVLQLAKSEAGKSKLQYAPVDLVAVSRSMCDLMSARALEKGLALSFHTAGDIPEYVEADESRLRQVLLNLVGNAVKFTEKGEVLVSLTGRASQNETVRIDFEIRDTGIGIDSKDIEDLFRPFVQLQGASVEPMEGTGLGLSISRDLVRAMGGDIEVESLPGQGSCFRFTLDFTLAPEATAQTVAEMPAVPGGVQSGQKVLVVDDVELNRKVLKELLGHFGYSVCAAASGKEALRLAGSDEFDAIVTDVFMPGMDGPQLGRLLRERKYPATIVGLTAAYDEAVRMDCLAAGFDLVLAKPVSGEALHRALAGILGARQPEPAAAPTVLPEFEPKYLEGYFDTLGEGPTLQMISGFRETIESEMERVSSASASGSTDLCSRALHKLGGAFATVGLLRLGRMLEELAMQVRTGGKAQLNTDEIRAKVDTSLQQLEAYLDLKTEDHGAEVV
jgi:signal transduction histidine kinase/CheY-like chemotaxis protein/HPt (histidine-containing phosphotransfer) domain-containing protein